jgi:hypothetical protein
MCITNFNAILESTKILSFRKKDGNVFIAYSNKVQNLHDGRNVMLLPIPGEVRTEWFYDTTPYNKFMKDIARQTIVSEYMEYGVRSRGIAKGMRSLSHTRVGQYDVFFSKNVDDMKEALNNESINANPDLMDFFASHYKGYTLVACLFSNRTTIDAQPIALEYKPFSDKSIFFPAMDSHDGRVPVRNHVEVDHSIIVENDIEPGMKGNVQYSQEVPEFIREMNFGTFTLDGRYENGDFYTDSTFKPNLKRSYETLILEPSTV